MTASAATSSDHLLRRRSGPPADDVPGLAAPNMATADFTPDPVIPHATDDSTVVGTRGGPAPARGYLRLQAIMWRFLMAIGMWLHRLAPPRPNRHAFTRTIPTTVSPNKGAVNLYFFTPKDYTVQRKLAKPSTRYPVVVNFHGGGFTIGHPLDDAKWATAVVKETSAVCVCVEYRLAPEYPFPTAVEDGVDALLYLARHADELHLDPEKIAVSGFSCGGNLAFTVPMRLHEELDPRAGRDSDSAAASLAEGVERVLSNAATDGAAGGIETLPQRQDGGVSSPVHPTKANFTTTQRELSSAGGSSANTETAPVTHGAPEIAPAIARVVKPVAIVAWYPSADYTLSRMQRRETCNRVDMELSPMFTSLFDSSYLSPPDLNKSNPFLSPGRAPAPLLRDGLPRDIVLVTCEWDMLRAEAQTLRDRLADLGKRVAHRMVEGVPHGWDKSPNPFAEAPGVREHYRLACRELRRVFRGEDDPELSGAGRRSFGIGRFSFATSRGPQGNVVPADREQRGSVVIM